MNKSSRQHSVEEPTIKTAICPEIRCHVMAMGLAARTRGAQGALPNELRETGTHR